MVDSQPLIRDWLKRVLSQELNIIICGEAGTASLALHDIANCSPHLAIVDLSLEDSSGLDLISQIVTLSPRTAVLVLSAQSEIYYARRVLRAGAKGYISKKQPIQQILVAVRQVLGGDIYFSPQCMQFLLRNCYSNSSKGRNNSTVENLSDRELEVFSMIGRGYGARRIAGALHISPRTVQTYCVRVRGKLQLQDATELHREAILWTETSSRRP